MLEAQAAHHRDALGHLGQFGRRLGDADLAMGMEGAIVAGQLADAAPQLHAGDRQADLGRVAVHGADAAGIDARRMPPDMAALQHDDAPATLGQVEGGRAAVQTAADDDDIGLDGHVPESSPSAANSPSVNGFSGGRMRKKPTSAGVRPVASAMMPVTVRPHMRP